MPITPAFAHSPANAAALLVSRVPWGYCGAIDQRFSTSGRRSPRGTSAVAKGHAGKNIVTKYFLIKQIT